MPVRAPLGITALEDKIVQSAGAEILNSVYEFDFQDCSFGFRAGRCAHDALRTVHGARAPSVHFRGRDKCASAIPFCRPATKSFQLSLATTASTMMSCTTVGWYIRPRCWSTLSRRPHPTSGRRETVLPLCFSMHMTKAFGHIATI